MQRETTPAVQRAEGPSDEELAGRAQQGCKASFEELVRRFQVPLLQFLRQRTSAADAEDLLQDTFVRAYQNLAKYRSAWRFRTWLYTIARRLSINHYRRRRPAEYEHMELIRSASPTAEEVVAAEEGRRRLWELAAEVLTEEQMAAVWLYYVEEMPVKEIAAVQDRSRVSVKTMLFRARQKLAPVLDGLQANGPRTNHNAKNQDARSNPTSCPKAAEVTNGYAN